MNLIKNFLEKGYLVEKDFIESIKEPFFNNDIFFNILLSLNPPKMISQDFFITNLDKIKKRISSFEENEDLIKIKLNLDNLSKDFQQNFPKIETNSFKENKLESEKEVIKSPLDSNEEQTSRKIRPGLEIEEEFFTPVKKIVVQDFVNYFRSRFFVLKNILLSRNLDGLTSIGKIFGQRRNLAIIGMVYEKRITKNKNIILTVEDLTGRINVLIRQDKEELYNKAKELVYDEVIAIAGSGSNEIIFANDIFFPDIIQKETKKYSEDLYSIFISDLHYGSDKFLEKNFLKFISWINGERGTENQRNLAKKIKYLFIVGDIVDSVGVYPSQRDELLVKDVYEQYKNIAEILSKIRKDIELIICPGNHDAVRLIEPQPRFDKKFANPLFELPNATITTNPAIVNIGKKEGFEGFKILLYHGFSFDYYMDNVEMLRQNNVKLHPNLVLDLLLRKRHLAPTHTSTPYFPNEVDQLLIKDVPDLFVTAHIHKSAISSYKGVRTIACSCWQSKTGYQERLGHEPDPCKVPIVNFKDGKITLMDFS